MLLTQALPLIHVGPAYGSSYWTQQGKISPDHKVAIKSLARAATSHAEKSIPFYRIHSAAKSKALAHPQVLARVNPAQSAVTGTTIDGIGYDGVTPPDVQVAAGPLNVMEMVNLEGETWAKDGSPQGPPFDLASFFGTGSDFISDPKVFYDSSGQRWVTSITDVSASTIKVAVSDSNDATGGFCVYTVRGPRFTILDQPIIGSSDDKIIVSANIFSSFTQQFLHSQYWVMNKGEMMSCSPASFVSKTSTSFFSIHPVHSLTSTETEYMVSTAATATRSLIEVFSVNGVPPNPVSVKITRLPVSSISDPPSAAQPGTILPLDTGDSRVQDAFLSNGTIWLAHNNACTPSGDSTTRSCLHFVKISTGTNSTSGQMSVMQDFDYGIVGKYLFYPAISETPNGNLVAVYGLSSSADYPGVEVTTQASTDQADSIDSPITLQPGNGSVTLLSGCLNTTGCRYGDYFGAGQDPSDPSKTWVAGEYGSGTLDYAALGKTWATKIGSITD